MHFLARLLHTDADISKELAAEESSLQDELHAFFVSYSTKQRVLQSLLRGESIYLHLHKLQWALREELQLIEDSERREKEILCDLKYLSREHYIKRLEELLGELGQAATRDKYAQKILEELHETIMSEARKVRRLLAGETDLTLHHSVIDLLMIEKHLIEKLTTVGDFRFLFQNVALGVAERSKVTKARERIAKRIGGLVRNVEIGPDGSARSVDGHYLSDLSARVFNKLEDSIMGAVESGSIGQHPFVDKEYVNSPLFERFVREEIKLDKYVGKCVPSERTTQAFIEAFRNMYGETA